MGRGGTCNHCGHHFQVPTRWRYSAARAWSATRKHAGPAFTTLIGLPFRLMNHLVRVNTRPSDLDGMSDAERLLVLEARKQTKLERANRSDMTCCLGCLLLLLILIFAPGIAAVVLALLGIGGLAAAQ